MPQNQAICQLYRLFADILEYPTPALRERAHECAAQLLPVNAEAAGHLEAFAAWVEETPPGRLEEIYTGTFDLQVVCYPYVGYHLFGESYKRGAFLAKLNEEYRSRGFSAETELPDHLAVILRFLAVLHDEDLERDLITECVVPALNRMQQVFKGKTDPYGEVIRALSLVFQGVSAVETAPTLRQAQDVASAKRRPEPVEGSPSGDWSSAGAGRLREGDVLRSLPSLLRGLSKGCRDFNRQAVATQEE